MEILIISDYHANLAAASASFRQATASFGNRLRHLGLQQRWMVLSPMQMVNDAWFELQVQPANANSSIFRRGRV